MQYKKNNKIEIQSFINFGNKVNIIILANIAKLKMKKIFSLLALKTNRIILTRFKI